MKRACIVDLFALLAIPAVCFGSNFRFFEPLNPPRPFQVLRAIELRATRLP